MSVGAKTATSACRIFPLPIPFAAASRKCFRRPEDLAAMPVISMLAALMLLALPVSTSVATVRDHVGVPHLAPEVTPLATTGYRCWRKARFKTIASLDEAWGSGYSAFHEIPAGQGLNQTTFNDWYKYWRHHLTGFIKTLSATVRKDDARHQINTNPASLMCNLANLSDNLPAWRPALTSLGEIDNRTGTVLARRNGHIVATENHFGRGTAFWIPSLVGTGAWFGGQHPLAEFMARVTAKAVKECPAMPSLKPG